MRIKETRAAIDTGLVRLQEKAEVVANKSAFRILWSYILGLFFIAVISLVLRSLSGLYSDVTNLLGPKILAVGGDWLTVTLIAIVFILPWLLGGIVQWMMRRIRPGQDLLPLQEVEQRLRTELSPDDFHAFRVALIDFPHNKSRVLGLITSEFREPGTDREVASVYVPNIPDAITGTIRVVALEDLVMTEWTFKDFVRFYLSYGATYPGSKFDQIPPA